MPAAKDPTRIFKNPISPKTPLKLGASATWSKLKYQTSNYSFNQNLKSNNNALINSVNGHQTNKFNRITKLGPNGEIFICYGTSIEVWDWIPSSSQLKQMETDGNFINSDSKDEFDGLYLVASLSDFKTYGQIIDIEPIEINQDTNTYKVLLSFQNDKEFNFCIKNFGQLFEEDIIEKQLILPPSIHGYAPFTIKASKRYVGISTNEGSLTIFDVEKAHPLSITIDINIENNKCLFDIQGRFLVYVPKPDGNTETSTNSSEEIFTKLNVPFRNRSIYSKIFNTLSMTALDGLTKLSDVSSIRSSLNDNNLKSNMKTYLSSLINGLHKTSSVVIFDLETEKQLACFQPPNGISNVSLSPFNSHLLTITQRGDQLYKWDLTRMPIEINLIDIQIRGKTGSIVESINWYSNDIFQIATQRSGSIHCFYSEYNSKNWILPNMNIYQISKIKYSQNNLIGLKRDSNELYVIDLKGMSNVKYQLPKLSIAKSLLPDYIPLEPVSEIIIREPQSKKTSPLAQIELESFSLGPCLAMNHRVQFATYKFEVKKRNDVDVEDEDDDDDNYENKNEIDENEIEIDDCTEFWKIYKVFGNEPPNHKLDLGKGDGSVVFHGGEDELVDALKSVMVYEEIVECS